VGIALHALFQSLLTSPGWRDPQEWKRRAEKTPWPEEAERLVQAAFTHPLPSPHGSFRLIDVDPDQVAAEFPFLTSEEPHFLKGFIDLVLIHQGYYYVIDWKSNWLGPTPDDYSPERIQQVIDAERYDLQAAIYQSALARHFSHVDLQSGGAFYLFLRSLPDGRGIHYIPPPSSR
jgi:ATP-dependent exoDNAse (exonuclease V) beta subunit